MDQKTYTKVQRWAKSLALGCDKFLPGAARLLLSKSGPSLSPSLYGFSFIIGLRESHAHGWMSVDVEAGYTQLLPPILREIRYWERVYSPLGSIKTPSWPIKPMIPRARGVIISHFCGFHSNQAEKHQSYWPRANSRKSFQFIR